MNLSHMHIFLEVRTDSGKVVVDFNYADTTAHPPYYAGGLWSFVYGKQYLYAEGTLNQRVPIIVREISLTNFAEKDTNYFLAVYCNNAPCLRLPLTLTLTSTALSCLKLVNKYFLLKWSWLFMTSCKTLCRAFLIPIDRNPSCNFIYIYSSIYKIWKEPSYKIIIFMINTRRYGSVGVKEKKREW